MIAIEELLKTTNDANPIKKSYLRRTRYYNDFRVVIDKLQSLLSESDVEDILTNKLQLSKAKYDKDTYFEAATEISVIYKIATIQNESFTYEKPIRSNTKKNPECTIHSSGFIINVEAKCPKLPMVEEPDYDGQKVFVMKSAGRIPGYFTQFEELKRDIEGNNQDVKMVAGKNKDNTMKSFLQSAHEKFADYRNDNELNVLFVALDDIHNIQEWWYYLFENEGLFTPKPFEDPKTYSRVDVVVFTNLLYRHKNNENINGNAWLVDDSFNLFLSNGHRQGAKENAHRYLLSYIKNHTEEIKKHKVEGSAPEYILEVLKVASYVREELEKNGIYYFNKKET